MAAPRTKNPKTLLDEVKEVKLEKNGEIPIDEMPLNSLGDYVRYNERARAMNKKLGVCRYKAKPCPEELHPKQRIVFGRNDQPENPLPVYVSDHMIHFDRTELKDQLRPGQTYDLPLYIIDHLAEKGTPVYKTIENPDGTKTCGIVSTSPRFALRTVYKNEY